MAIYNSRFKIQHFDPVAKASKLWWNGLVAGTGIRFIIKSPDYTKTGTRTGFIRNLKTFALSTLILELSESISV